MYQWSAFILIHSHMYIHVWRMCGFTSMIWHHLHSYPLPRYQLLSPIDIQPLVNDLPLQPTSMEWLHSGPFTHKYIHVWRMCGFTSMIWHHLHSYPLPVCQLLSPPDIQPLVNDLWMQPTSTEFVHPDSFTDIFMWHMCRIIATTKISHHRSRSHPSLPLRSDVEVQLNHLALQRHTPVNA